MEAKELRRKGVYLSKGPTKREKAERQEPGPQVFSGLVGAMLWGSMSKTGELVSPHELGKNWL